MRIKMATLGGAGLIAIFILFTVAFIFVDNGKPDESQSAGEPGVSAKAQNHESAYVVTPVWGPSWVKQLGIFDIRFTAMGEMGGYEPPPPSPRKEPKFPVEATPPRGRMGMGMGGMMGRSYFNYRFSPSELENMMVQSFFLAGIDFYRLDCQSCHGPTGSGAPPEINSLIGPFQGTSPALIEERMKKLGRPIGEALAMQLASQAEESIRQRLQNGGKKMPSFRHLERKEVDALIQYLQQYVGAPESQGKELLVVQSVPRVGEHLVKGTCHICHDATGPGRGMGMMARTIPSLASFPWEQSMQSVVWQVKLGSRPMMMAWQRMPPYPYITTAEAAASYLYLVQYPPYY
jgi:mono/diheme cytochrome c family protein